MRLYDSADSRQIWTEAVAAIPTPDVDPQSPPRFTFDRATKIASAGSCFAQRVAQELSARGFTYVRAERDCDFSARYGNIYTTRQLAQLLERATGAFRPSEDVWTNPQGRYIDPFRARAVPEGFPSVKRCVPIAGSTSRPSFAPSKPPRSSYLRSGSPKCGPPRSTVRHTPRRRDTDPGNTMRRSTSFQ